jgi:hypothetical protein
LSLNFEFLVCLCEIVCFLYYTFQILMCKIVGGFVVSLALQCIEDEFMLFWVDMVYVVLRRSLKLCNVGC